MNEPLISLIHISRGWEKSEQVRNLWTARAENKGSFEYILRTDAGPVFALNQGALVARGQILVTVADDVEPPDRWDETLLRLIPLDRPAVLGVGDGLRKDKLLCHPILNRLRYEQQDFNIIAPEFDRSDGIYGDTDFTFRAYRDRVVIEARDVVFAHHWIGPDGTDHNSWKNYRVGRAIYRQRNPVAGFGSVAVGVRIAHAPDPDFFHAWTNLLRCGLRAEDQILGPAIGLPHSCAANYLVEEFLHSGCDSLLFLDDDMVFAWDALERLRQGPDGFGIMAGLSTSRRAPYLPVAFRRDAEDKPYLVPNDELKGIVPVDIVGLAFTLVRREAIDALVEQNGEDHNIFEWNNRSGEDGIFCRAAKKLGFKVGINADIVLGHMCRMAASWGQKDNSAVMTYQQFESGKKESALCQQQ